MNGTGNVETYPNDGNENEEPVSEFEGVKTIALLEVKEEDNDPCDKISNLLNETKNPGVKNKLIQLIGKTIDSTEVGANQIVQDTTSTINDITPGSDGYLDIDPPTSGKFSFIAHTHNAPANSTYSVFSWWDLSDGLYSWIKNNQITNNFVYFVFTADGTYYAITVQDASKFKKFFTSVKDLSTNPSIEQIQTLQKKESAYGKYYKPNTDSEGDDPLIKEDNTDDAQDLKYFLEILKNNDLGIEVFETDNTLSSFDKVSFDENGNIKEENCN